MHQLDNDSRTHRQEHRTADRTYRITTVAGGQAHICTTPASYAAGRGQRRSPAARGGDSTVAVGCLRTPGAGDWVRGSGHEAHAESFGSVVRVTRPQT